MEKTHQRLKNFFKLSLKRLIDSCLLSLAFLAYSNVQAQELKLISDEETEQFLAQMTQPLFAAAGINYDRNKIHIVEDNSLNAFVSDGNRLFIHTGTIIGADSANELAGVIAHETGHIEGGHILRQKLKNQEMQEITLASALLAGTAAALSGKGDAAMAVILGSQSSALTHYTNYRTEEERSADESALKLLNKTGQNPQGMLNFMKKIAQQNQLNGIEETPYFRTHPITRERISFFEKAVKNSHNLPTDNRQADFERIKAKIYAYLMPAEMTFKKYLLSDNSAHAQYAHAVAFFKQLKFDKAQNKLDNLIKNEPKNPYLYELKGQIFLETGKINAAQREYEKALQLLPDSALLQMSLAQAILENQSSLEKVKEATALLNKALIKRPTSFGWMLLARAYDMQGERAAANYASAEFSLRQGAIEASVRQAETAQKENPSPQIALKIDDLLKRLQEIKKKS